MWRPTREAEGTEAPGGAGRQPAHDLKADARVVDRGRQRRRREGRRRCRRGCGCGWQRGDDSKEGSRGERRACRLPGTVTAADAGTAAAAAAAAAAIAATDAIATAAANAVAATAARRSLGRPVVGSSGRGGGSGGGRWSSGVECLRLAVAAMLKGCGRGTSGLAACLTAGVMVYIHGSVNIASPYTPSML